MNWGPIAAAAGAPVVAFIALIVTRGRTTAEKDRTISEAAETAVKTMQAVMDRAVAQLQREIESARVSADTARAVVVELTGRIALLERQHRECQTEVAALREQVHNYRNDGDGR